MIQNQTISFDSLTGAASLPSQWLPISCCLLTSECIHSPSDQQSPQGELLLFSCRPKTLFLISEGADSFTERKPLSELYHGDSARCSQPFFGTVWEFAFLSECGDCSLVPASLCRPAIQLQGHHVTGQPGGTRCDERLQQTSHLSRLRWVMLRCLWECSGLAHCCVIPK